jgi:glutamate formiminotransferase
MLDRAVEQLDVRIHDGVHPRFGVVDVLPIVPFEASVEIARGIAQRLAAHADELHVPTYFYDDENPLPQLRRILRSSNPPAHPTAGVLCIGVRSPLIAFNVNARTDMATAREIVRDLRKLPGVRALAFELPSRPLLQISMNLMDPAQTGPKAAYQRIVALGVDVVDAETVGLVPQSSLAELDGLPLREPARSVEEALGR